MHSIQHYSHDPQRCLDFQQVRLVQLDQRVERITPCWGSLNVSSVNSIIKTRQKAIKDSKIKDCASLNMSATRSGRTWLLLLFRWLDSYCVKALVLSLNWLEPRTWIFIKYWCHYGLSIDGYEIFWSRNVILQTDGKRNLSSNLMLNSVGVIKSHFLTCNGEILIRITSSKYSVKHS